MKINIKIDSLIGSIKRNPLNQDLRLELIQYYCIDGRWDSALKSIQQYVKLNPKDSQSKGLFYGNINCEIKRQQVLLGHQKAEVYPGLSVELINHQNEILNNYLLKDFNLLQSQFLNTLSKVNNTFECNTGKQISTGSFIDTDCRLAFVVEIFCQDNYYWISINDIEKIIFKDNEFLTDLMWRRGEIFTKDNQHIPCFFPVRYPLTESIELADSFKYSTTTEWFNTGELSTAIGQKVLSNGDVDISFLDIHSLNSI